VPEWLFELARDSEWRYINARGNFLFVEATIDQETHCADFEPNSEDLSASHAVMSTPAAASNGASGVSRSRPQQCGK
jgi:hypothetical protein